VCAGALADETSAGGPHRATAASPTRSYRGQVPGHLANGAALARNAPERARPRYGRRGCFGSSGPRTVDRSSASTSRGGESAATDLCAIQDGRVINSGRLVAFEDIVAWLEPHTTGDCVVAVDAPLIVRNLSGQHQCEWLVSKCFSRHDAGAHSSNRGMDAFRDGGRAFRLASRLGLALDPRMDDERLGRRRIIEVYPHPALVALFDLPKCLKYKAKRGRTVSSRKAEFGRCIELLESLDGAVPKLDLAVTKRADLKAELRLALTDRALDRAEDELDAFVCAYIACYYWTHGTRRCRVIGDVDYGYYGYIVTPVSAGQGACLDRLAAEG
jgi:predicted RNase H-like nuclease